MTKKMVALEIKTHELLKKESKKRKKNRIPGTVIAIGSIADEYIAKHCESLQDA